MCELSSWLNRDKRDNRNIYIYILRLIMSKRNSHSRSVGPIRQTKRRDVPHLLTLHLLCVCYFTNEMRDFHVNLVSVCVVALLS